MPGACCLTHKCQKRKAYLINLDIILRAGLKELDAEFVCQSLTLRVGNFSFVLVYVALVPHKHLHKRSAALGAEQGMLHQTRVCQSPQL